jgi:hypothetical protein
MGTIERDLQDCCTGCDSNKVTERKVGIFLEQLLRVGRN